VSHSGLGIASFIIGLASLVFAALIFTASIASYISGGPYSTAPGYGLIHGSSQAQVEMGVLVLSTLCILVCSLASCLLGLILGLIALGQTDRQHLFTWAGIVINLAIVLAICGFFGSAIITPR
jgi:hypothetical protein